MDPKRIDPTWGTGFGLASYGVVLINHKGKVLLRKPTNNFGGYAWTFAKGQQETGQTPAQTAIAECEQETGYTPVLLGTLAGAFLSDSTGRAYFFIGTSIAYDALKMDWETEEIRWVSFERARRLIKQSMNEMGKRRDLAILAAAQNYMKRYF